MPRSPPPRRRHPRPPKGRLRARPAHRRRRRRLRRGRRAPPLPASDGFRRGEGFSATASAALRRCRRCLSGSRRSSGSGTTSGAFAAVEKQRQRRKGLLRVQLEGARLPLLPPLPQRLLEEKLVVAKGERRVVVVDQSHPHERLASAAPVSVPREDLLEDLRSLRLADECARRYRRRRRRRGGGGGGGRSSGAFLREVPHSRDAVRPATSCVPPLPPRRSLALSARPWRAR